MSDLSRDDLIRQLKENALLSAEDLDALKQTEETSEDSETLLKQLVADKKLTPFQAKHVWKGRARSLVLGNYVVLDKLGQGGMGMVFKAQHKLMKRVVALKVLSQSVVKREDAVKRFLREVEVAAKLSHPNIVAAHDADQSNGSYYLIMEYVDGRDLSEMVDQQGTATVEQATDFILQAARGLEYAHANGVIHRDIKPANLLLDTSGTIKILDMGLARLETQEETSQAGRGALTSTGTIMGTVDFMAPEQAEDTKSAGPQADIYSLGASLYFLLLCEYPLIEGTIGQKLKGLMTGSGVPRSIRTKRPDVPETLDAVYRKMTELEPANRYQSMSEVIADLEAIRAGASPMTAMGGIRPMGARSESSAMHSFLDSLDERNQFSPETFAEPPGNALKFETVVDLPEETAGIKPGGSQAARGLSQFPKSKSIIVGSLAVLVVVGGFFIWNSNGPDSEELASSTPAEEHNETTASSLSEAGNAANEAPGSTATVEGAADGWINLLANVDPAANAVAGQWELTDDGLHCNVAMGARLKLPYKPPAEYDFRIDFTRRTGSDSIALIFTHGGNPATFELDAWSRHLAGIQFLVGQSLNENSTRTENIRLVNGTRYTAELRVRNNRVEAYLDGKLLTSVETDGSNLSVLPAWELRGNTAIGVGSFNAATTFHAIEVRPIMSSDAR